MAPSSRPGLVKVKQPALARQKRVELVAMIDGRLRDLLERVDVVSEGAIVEEASGPVYYGSTSLALSASALGVDATLLEQLAHLDPHLRTRALRLARREIAQRSGGAELATLRAEISIERRGDAVFLVIDAEGALPRTKSASR